MFSVSRVMKSSNALHESSSKDSKVEMECPCTILRGYRIIAGLKEKITSKRLLDGEKNMNGRDMLLVLTHLFRKKGDKVPIDTAIEFLSFDCRYGHPTNIRRMLSSALENDMISRDGDIIKAAFLYDKQQLPLNLTAALKDKVRFNDDVTPLR
jgi:hypothetical protein